jgi:adenylate kinase
MDVRYLQKALGSSLTDAMAQVAMQKSRDPVKLVGEFLRKRADELAFLERAAAAERQAEYDALLAASAAEDAASAAASAVASSSKEPRWSAVGAGAPKLVIAGPPAAGKGTQCTRIVERYGVVHISTGDMLRAEVAAGSAEGLAAKAAMDAGAYVSDDLITAMLVKKLATDEVRAKGFLLDGFPRTAAQAASLTAITDVDAFITLEVPDEKLVQRAVGRRSDPETGKIYHLVTDPPPADDAALNERLVHRADDNEETVLKRLATYRASVAATKAHFGAHRFPGFGVLVAVDADRARDVITRDIFAVIEEGVLPLDAALWSPKLPESTPPADGTLQARLSAALCSLKEESGAADVWLGRRCGAAAGTEDTDADAGGDEDEGGDAPAEPASIQFVAAAAEGFTLEGKAALASGDGATWALFAAPAAAEGDEEEEAGGDEDAEATPAPEGAATPAHLVPAFADGAAVAGAPAIHIPNVLRAGGVKFAGVPKFGALGAIKFTYDAIQHSGDALKALSAYVALDGGAGDAAAESKEGGDEGEDGAAGPALDPSADYAPAGVALATTDMVLAMDTVRQPSLARSDSCTAPSCSCFLFAHVLTLLFSLCPLPSLPLT